MLKVFTAFSGYDSQCMALEKAGIDYELVGWSEIDKNAILVHDAIYPQWKDRNYGDICSIDWNKIQDFDLFTYSSPCQDFSRAGTMKGGQEGSNTRSSLLWECRKAITIKRPKYCILENVMDLVSSRFFPLFQLWLQELESLGYENHWKVLSASDHGLPQNRNRVFLISVRKFVFPEKKELKKTLDQILEKHVDERYYISASKYPCILTNQPDPNMLHVRQATKKGFIEVKIGGLFDAAFPNSKTRRGRVQGNGGDISPTLTRTSSNTILRFEGYKDGEPIIRRLTERERFRLMGVSDLYINLIQDTGIGERVQGNLAGNSICVDVLADIFRNLL